MIGADMTATGLRKIFILAGGLSFVQRVFARALRALCKKRWKTRHGPPEGQKPVSNESSTIKLTCL
jgi:hypothetical protein